MMPGKSDDDNNNNNINNSDNSDDDDDDANGFGSSDIDLFVYGVDTAAANAKVYTFSYFQVSFRV